MVRLQNYRGISAGDTAILQDGREVNIREIEVYTSEGASLGIFGNIYGRRKLHRAI